MSDLIFVPCPHPDVAPPRGGAPVVYLRPPLYVLRGMYHHPISDEDRPLPPHRWALVNSTQTSFSEGTTSDGDGISAIFRTEMLDGAPDDTWDIWLIPIFDDGRPSSEIVVFGEVWIDVDRNRWVSSREVAAGELYGAIEARRLLRIPRWSTARKAAYGGGFKESNSDSLEFDTTGRLRTSELVSRGSPAAPWTLQIDHGWLRSYVQLRFYDPIACKEKALPQGIILEARASIAGPGGSSPRVGASSVRRDDGSIYVLHAREAARSTDLEYKFATPEGTRLDYAKGTYASGPITDLACLEHEYPVAPLWNSWGMEAWEGASDADGASRKPFYAIRTKGQTASSPLSFHLDDLVLVDVQGRVVVPKAPADRLAIYDGVAALRDPVKSSRSKDLPYTKLGQVQFPLRAEEATFRRTFGLSKVTRFIEHDGELYELSTSFLGGVLEQDQFVGARAAVEAVPIEDNRRSAQRSDVVTGHRVYLFDSRWVRHSYQGHSTRLAHLVMFVSILIDTAQLNAANRDAELILEELMVTSANHWDQNHPGVEGSSKLPKDYVIVPEAGVKDGSTLLKVRHVFTRRMHRGNDPITVQVDTQPGRASAGHPMRLYCAHGRTSQPAPNLAWLLPNPGSVIPGARLPKSPYAFEPIGDAVDVDGSHAARSTFAHELGHESGLNDEYVESIALETIHEGAEGLLPRFYQHGQHALPYAFDRSAFMNGNHFPRLRYLHDPLEALHEDGQRRPSDHWFKSERPFVAQYIARDLTYRFALPRKAPRFSRAGGPWSALTGRQGLCNLSLYPASMDEGTFASSFSRKAMNVDGILVVHPMIWFSFAPSLRDASERWKAMARWGATFSTGRWAPRFAIRTYEADEFQHVAVILQPRFEYGPAPSLVGTSLQTKSDATLEVQLRRGGGGPTVNTSTFPVLLSTDIDTLPVEDWLLRYALQPQPATLPSKPRRDALAPADLHSVAQALAMMLGRSAVGVVTRVEA